eukprot:CAMPEP_0170187348 /NCGR_PEP_ID=MMETSP0040_2-20121228/41492_1 /TAXON_ID=641309 /ORGANISM="Lotharella oceanica, Strain CCMP622" /LENGTH=157 /DNA_ID=CAMNT_0010434359 /DNA_START=1 /DNA_END=471 /DNA_ORIENTATION=-
MAQGWEEVKAKANQANKTVPAFLLDLLSSFTKESRDSPSSHGDSDSKSRGGEASSTGLETPGDATESSGDDDKSPRISKFALPGAMSLARVLQQLKDVGGACGEDTTVGEIVERVLEISGLPPAPFSRFQHLANALPSPESPRNSSPGTPVSEVLHE